MRKVGWALLWLLCGCGDEGATAELADGSSGPGASSEGGEDPSTTGSAEPPGPSAQGWEEAYVEGGGALNCDQSAAEMEAGEAGRLSFESSTIYVGFEQIGDNQNAIAARVDDGAVTYCIAHETEGPDSRALALTWDGGEAAYIVYSVVGGGSALDAAASGGWLPSYAPGSISGGGPKVSVIGRMNTADGTLEAATFVIAVKSDNTVNSHGTRGAVTVRDDGNIEFQGESAHKPIDADGRSSMDCTDYPFDSRYVFSADLSELVCADCTNCTAQAPC